MCLIPTSRKFWLDFCYDPRNKIWYEFADHHWVASDLGLGITSKISNELCQSYEEVKRGLELSAYSASCEDRPRIELRVKTLSRIASQLKDVTVKSKLLSELREFFVRPKAHSIMDCNPFITGVRNGVIEVNDKEAIFRDGKPEDYITMCTYVDYVEQTWEDPNVVKVLNWISQVFPDPCLYNHFLKFAASLLKAGNKEKIFPIWTGSSDNSKSMIVKLFEVTLGDYSITFPIAMISDKALANTGPSPELARARGTRVVFLTEPDNDINLKKGIIKKYTGGDTLPACCIRMVKTSS